MFANRHAPIIWNQPLTHIKDIRYSTLIRSSYHEYSHHGLSSHGQSIRCSRTWLDELIKTLFLPVLSQIMFLQKRKLGRNHIFAFKLRVFFRCLRCPQPTSAVAGHRNGDNDRVLIGWKKSTPHLLPGTIIKTLQQNSFNSL